MLMLMSIIIHPYDDNYYDNVYDTHYETQYDTYYHKLLSHIIIYRIHVKDQQADHELHQDHERPG